MRTNPLESLIASSTVTVASRESDQSSSPVVDRVCGLAADTVLDETLVTNPTIHPGINLTTNPTTTITGACLRLLADGLDKAFSDMHRDVGFVSPLCLA